MTPGLPDGRRGQAVALALLVAACGLVWAAVASPLLGWYGARAQHLAEQRMMLAHMARTAASLPALRRAAGSATTGGPPAAALLAGQTDAIAGATLQGMVQDMATAAGATLTSTEALPGAQQGAFRRIGLRVSLGGDWPVLVALLQAVESNPVHLLVDDLQLHAAARNQPGNSHLGPASIEASFVVLGFRPGHEAPPDLRADAAAQSR